jgi:hypothetical protein
VRLLSAAIRPELRPGPLLSGRDAASNSFVLIAKNLPNASLRGPSSAPWPPLWPPPKLMQLAAFSAEFDDIPHDSHQVGAKGPRFLQKVASALDGTRVPRAWTAATPTRSASEGARGTSALVEGRQRRVPRVPTRASPILLHNPAETGQGGQDDQECHKIAICARRPFDLASFDYFAHSGSRRRDRFSPHTNCPRPRNEPGKLRSQDFGLPDTQLRRLQHSLWSRFLGTVKHFRARLFQICARGRPQPATPRGIKKIFRARFFATDCLASRPAPQRPGGWACHTTPAALRARFRGGVPAGFDLFPPAFHLSPLPAGEGPGVRGECGRLRSGALRRQNARVVLASSFAIRHSLDIELSPPVLTAPEGLRVARRSQAALSPRRSS